MEGSILDNPAQRKTVDVSGTVYDNPYPVKKGVEFAYDLPQICKNDPGFVTQLAYQSSRFATPLVLLAAFFLLDRLIAAARRDNGFDEAVVRRLRFLGLFLIAGTLATSISTTVIETGLALSMVAGTVGEVGAMALHGWAVPWAYLIAGLGLVVMSKVVRVGTYMREELQGTV
ncbi:DUF2975 domain-containing protein [Nonomuraea sp. NPDC049158]|uniref:DUF2975 domain-containing protein n=1 Tax=Nonomuraea sp. NPDC049158 TaxID=3155649 RepID=UPI0033DD3860